MKNSTLTLCDVLPADLKSKYADVLDVTMEEAIQIAKLSMPPSSNLTANQVNEIKEIYKTYLAKHDDNSDSAYWNKSASDNAAYWSKNK
jgi:type III secretory pathway component EscR